MKTKLFVLAAAALIAWGLKRYYAEAEADGLAWILRPTAAVASGMSGVAFEPVPGEGFVSRERLFVIEKVCAGVNFMIAAFAMLVLALLHRVRSGVSALLLLSAGVALSYLTAVIANATRIVVALWMAAYPIASAPRAPGVHRIEGIVVYFGALLLTYEVIRRADRTVPVPESRS